MQWLTENEIKLNNKSIKLNKEHRYSLLKLIFMNPSIEASDKQELLEKEK